LRLKKSRKTTANSPTSAASAPATVVILRLVVPALVFTLLSGASAAYRLVFRPAAKPRLFSTGGYLLGAE
jgi:hypothetical protein